MTFSHGCPCAMRTVNRSAAQQGVVQAEPAGEGALALAIAARPMRSRSVAKKGEAQAMLAGQRPDLQPGPAL